jgi:hypothetical protein
MATAAPLISQANLSPGGDLIAPPASKKPVYSIPELGLARQTRLFYRPVVGSPARQPKHLLFGAISDPKLRVLKPIPVEMSQRKGSYIARFHEADEFGAGATVSLALEDLGKTLSELFTRLTEQQESLGPDMKHLHAVLSRFINYRR